MDLLCTQTWQGLVEVPRTQEPVEMIQEPIILDIYMGHSKNNEANVLQNGQKKTYINSLRAIFLSCLIIIGMTHIMCIVVMSKYDTFKVYINMNFIHTCCIDIYQS